MLPNTSHKALLSPAERCFSVCPDKRRRYKDSFPASVRKGLLTLTFFILLIMSVQDIRASSSNFGAAFREKLVGARPLAMGGAYTALAEDPLALIWNPAAIHNQQTKYSLTLEHTQLLDLFEYSFIGYTHRIAPGMSLGVGLLHSGDDIMSESTCYLGFSTDLSFLNGVDEGMFFSIPASARFGLTTKYHFASFGNDEGTDFLDFYGKNHRVSGSAAGFGLDLGLKLTFGERDHLGTSVKNLFSTISWESENEAGTALGSYSESVPLHWTVGYARTGERWNGSIDIMKALTIDVEDVLYAGVEYLATDIFHLQGGYSQELVTADNKKLSAGIAVTLKPPGLPTSTLNFTYIIHTLWRDNRSYLFSIRLPVIS